MSLEICSDIKHHHLSNLTLQMFITLFNNDNQDLNNPWPPRDATVGADSRLPLLLPLRRSFAKNTTTNTNSDVFIGIVGPEIVHLVRCHHGSQKQSTADGAFRGTTTGMSKVEE